MTKTATCFLWTCIKLERSNSQMSYFKKISKTKSSRNTLGKCNLTTSKSLPSEKRFGYLKICSYSSLIGTTRYWDTLEVPGKLNQSVNRSVFQDSGQNLKLKFGPATHTNATRDQTRRLMESFLSSEHCTITCHGNAYITIQLDHGQLQ